MRKITIGFQINGEHIDDGTIGYHLVTLITIGYHLGPLVTIWYNLVTSGTIKYH